LTGRLKGNKSQGKGTEKHFKKTVTGGPERGVTKKGGGQGNIESFKTNVKERKFGEKE